MCLCIHFPFFVDNFHGRHKQLQSSLLNTIQSSKVHAVVNHACEHVNILVYTEHFRAYMDFGNQGATNIG